MQKNQAFYLTLIAVVSTAFVILCARCATGDVMDATVRLFEAGGGPAGTGTVFADDGKALYISTCEHVVEGQKGLSAEFYRDGYASKKIPAKIVLRGRRRDADGAVLTVPRSAFGQRGPPKAIPWASPGTPVHAGDTMISVGCANGAWATLFRGHITKVDSQQGLIYFVPAPAGGRSGSAIFDKTGTKILGILFARVGGDTGGIATSVDVFYWLWAKQQAAMNQPVYTLCGTANTWSGKRLLPIPPYRIVPPPRVKMPLSVVKMPIIQVQCPPGGCYGQRNDYRQPQAEPDSGGAGIFPGLPWGTDRPRQSEQPTGDIQGALQQLMAQLEANSKADRDFQSKVQQIADSLMGQEEAPPILPQTTLPTIGTPSKLGEFPWELAVTAVGTIVLYFFLPTGIAATTIRFALPWVGKLMERGFGAAMVKRINDPNDEESNQAIEVIGKLAAKGANGGKANKATK